MTSVRQTRAQRKAATRTRLLEAAADVFGRRGFQAASVDEVAEAAGFTKGAVYAHFESKEDLFLALLDDCFTQRITDLRAVLEDGHDPNEQAREAGDAVMSSWDSDPGWPPLFFEFWTHAVRNPDVAAKLVPRYRAMRTAVAELLERRAHELGKEPVLPIEDVAAMTFAMANGAALEHMLEPEGVGPELYGTMLEVFFRGLAAMAEERAAAGSR